MKILRGSTSAADVCVAGASERWTLELVSVGSVGGDPRVRRWPG
jgi:hypothetical protein